MIVLHRSASIASGKGAQAMAFAQEVAKYLTSKYKLDIQVMLPIGGNPQRIAWVSRYKDMAAIDALFAKALADTKYQELAAKGSAHFIQGSMVDSFWRTI